MSVTWKDIPSASRNTEYCDTLLRIDGLIKQVKFASYDDRKKKVMLLVLADLRKEVVKLHADHLYSEYRDHFDENGHRLD